MLFYSICVCVHSFHGFSVLTSVPHLYCTFPTSFSYETSYYTTLITRYQLFLWFLSGFGVCLCTLVALLLICAFFTICQPLLTNFRLESQYYSALWCIQWHIMRKLTGTYYFTGWMHIKPI